jgi:hypothetical protein
LEFSNIDAISDESKVVLSAAPEVLASGPLILSSEVVGAKELEGGSTVALLVFMVGEDARASEVSLVVGSAMSTDMERSKAVEFWDSFVKTSLVVRLTRVEGHE